MTEKDKRKTVKEHRGQTFNDLDTVLKRLGLLPEGLAWLTLNENLRYRWLLFTVGIGKCIGLIYSFTKIY